MQIPVEIVRYIESCYKWDADLTQEVYLAILEKPDDYEINKGWCQATYENLRNRATRDDQRRRELLRENEDAVRGTFYDENQACDPAEVFEGEEVLDDRADYLSPLISKTLELHYVKGLTVEAIAKRERVDTKAIYERLRVGRNILRGETQ